MTDDRRPQPPTAPSPDRDEQLDADLLASWAADDPPEGFAERVIAAAREQPAVPPPEPVTRPRWEPTRRLKWGAAGVVAACAVLLFMVMQSRPRFPGVAGELTASGRTEVALGHRGVAVAEPGAQVSWRVGDGGAAEVEQHAGDVFYRVEAGGRFSVRTPHGLVTVQGTCFRVEVLQMKPSKHSIGGAAVGAAVAAALVVTVYEGRVLFAGPDGATRTAAAGETVVVPSGASAPAGSDRPDPIAGPGVTDDDPALAVAPPDDASRDELLARDERQRQRIAALRRELDGARAGLADVRRQARDQEVDGDGQPWFDPSPETLRAFAKECRVRFDLPPFRGAEPMQISARDADRFGVTAKELPVVNEVLRDVHAYWIAFVRQLYIEATGDASGADTLSIEAMSREIQDKALPGEAERIRQLLAQERAGLIAPPGDWSTASPIERYLRHLAAAGDEVEVMFAARLGRERARQLREDNGGWGMRMEMAGCPDDDAAEHNEDLLER